jgi:hypothetical protein
MEFVNAFCIDPLFEWNLCIFFIDPLYEWNMWMCFLIDPLYEWNLWMVFFYLSFICMEYMNAFLLILYMNGICECFI